ncbi:inositol monophosphatase family protein [Patescibacteria group bacterium]
MKYSKEHSFVRSLTKNLIGKVSSDFGSIVATKEKSGHADIVTDQDLRLDRFIIRKIKKNFPKDVIVTEESSAKLLPRAQQGERSWIVDPLCGSFNYARALPIFNTNIILAENGKVVAAWVVDYPLKRLLWSTGDGTYVNNKKLKRLRHPKGIWIIELDNNGYTKQLSNNAQRKFADVARDVILRKDILFRGFNSSLVFAYVATGQVQGNIIMRVEPWDQIAEAFLITQNGGIATHFDGTPWDLSSRSLVMAQSKKIHSSLLAIIRKHKLTKHR